VFEGPLDLLLFLIRKHEIDIYDIPIERVLDQYLDAMRAMQEVKLEIAGDFFVMAATLMEIKSRLLLPRRQRSQSDDEDDDEFDPRWELVHQLLEYKKFKEAARSLDALAEAEAERLPRDPDAARRANLAERPLQPEDPISVWNAYNTALRRLAETMVTGEIQDDSLTVVDQMETLIAKLEAEPRFAFSSLFQRPCSLRELIVTFIAVLELVRLRRLAIRQDAAFADFELSRPEETDETEEEPAEKELETEPISSSVAACNPAEPEKPASSAWASTTTTATSGSPEPRNSPSSEAPRRPTNA